MRIERFLPVDFLSGDGWMALRQLAFGAPPAVVPRPTRLRLAALGFVRFSERETELTRRGIEALRLGDR
jgi:hypothetical protein